MAHRLLLLAASLLCGFWISLPAPLAAQQPENFRYTSDGSAITIRGCLGHHPDMVIPETLHGLPVKAIGAKAFYMNFGLRTVAIPNSVTEIQEGAFRFCSSLTQVTIGSAAKNIEMSAFAGCVRLTSFAIAPDNPFFTSIDGVLFDASASTLLLFPLGKEGGYTIPNHVKAIGPRAFFEHTNLSSITIPDGVISIADEAFWGALALQYISLPDSVTSIGSSAFARCMHLTRIDIGSGLSLLEEAAFALCAALEEIHVSDASSAYRSIDGVLFDKSATTLIACPAGKKGVYTIPEGVTSISSHAFSSCQHLTGINIPQSTLSISSSAFIDCARLERFDVSPLNPAYQSIDGVLYHTSEASLFRCPVAKTGHVEMPAGITSINDSAFSGCAKLSSVSISDGVLTIGSGAFYDCPELTSVTMPDSIQSIGDEAFHWSAITSVNLGKNLKTIGNWTFANCPNLIAVTIPEGITHIGIRAFGECSGLTSLAIPDNVLSIGEDAFVFCEGLTSVSIGSGTQSLDAMGFAHCYNLERIDISPANAFYYSIDGVLFEKNTATLMYFPLGKTGNYTVPENTKAIGDRAFQSHSGLTGIAIPSSVSSIGEQAFLGCSQLREVILPEGIDSIADLAFFSCNNLASATFLGDAPARLGEIVFGIPSSPDYPRDFIIRYYEGSAGFTTPFWQDYATQALPRPPGMGESLRVESFTLQGGVAALSVMGKAGWTYELEWCGRLDESFVTVAATRPLAAAGPVVLTHEAGTAGQGFYRVAGKAP